MGDNCMSCNDYGFVFAAEDQDTITDHLTTTRTSNKSVMMTPDQNKSEV